MPKGSHNPVRTCIGCMKREAAAEMIRIAARDGNIVTDFEANIAGRGAYLHRNAECLDRFVKSKVKEFKSLRRKIEPENRIRIAKSIRDRLDRIAAEE